MFDPNLIPDNYDDSNSSPDVLVLSSAIGLPVNAASPSPAVALDIDATASTPVETTEVISVEAIPTSELPLIEIPLDEQSLSERPAPIITNIVLPSGHSVSPDEAAAEAANSALPPQSLFDDEGAHVGHLTIPGKPGVSRDETIWFGQLSDDIIDIVEEMPGVLAQIAEVDGKKFKNEKDIDTILSELPFEKKLEATRYMAEVYRKVRLTSEDGTPVIKNWTLVDAAGKVREVTDAAIEKLPPAIRQALSEAIIKTATSGQEEHVFTPASSR